RRRHRPPGTARPAARGRDPAVRRLPRPGSPAARRRRRGVGPGRATARDLGARAGRGPRGPPRLVRPRGRRTTARARHGRLPRRPVGDRDRVPRARGAGRVDPRRVANVRRRDRRRARRRPAHRARRERRRRRTARPARRRAAAHRRARLLLPARLREPPRRDARARPARGRARPRRGGRRVPGRGRLGARPRDRRRAAADRDGHVVYLRSLTKSAAPGLRIAAVGARGAAGARLRAVRLVDDLFVSGPLQEAALDLVTSPAWRRHLRRLRAALRERRDALAGAVERNVPDLRVTGLPAGGLHLWAALPDDVDDVAAAAAAAARGVVVYPGRPWFPADPPGPFLRLTFAAAPPEALDEGARRLAVAIRR